MVAAWPMTITVANVTQKANDPHVPRDIKHEADFRAVTGHSPCVARTLEATPATDAVAAFPG
jgi:hypothetical protein